MNASELGLLLEHILQASTSIETLNFNLGESLNESTVRTQYKKLAVLVHPDKNASPTANECFIKLKAACEDLLLNIVSTTTAPHLQDDIAAAAGKTEHPKRKHFATSMQAAVHRTSDEKFQSFNAAVSDEELNIHSNNWSKFLQEFNTRKKGRMEASTSIGTVEGKDEFVEGREREVSDRGGLQGTNTHLEETETTTNKLEPSLSHASSTQSSTLSQQSKSYHFLCELCARRFQSINGLLRHQKQSVLHAENLKKDM